MPGRRNVAGLPDRRSSLGPNRADLGARLADGIDQFAIGSRKRRLIGRAADEPLVVRSSRSDARRTDGESRSLQAVRQIAARLRLSPGKPADEVLGSAIENGEEFPLQGRVAERLAREVRAIDRLCWPFGALSRRPAHDRSRMPRMDISTARQFDRSRPPTMMVNMALTTFEIGALSRFQSRPPKGRVGLVNLVFTAVRRGPRSAVLSKCATQSPGSSPRAGFAVSI